jgi:transcriptional regulator with PAS, ATPase and Fis domain
VASGGTLFLDEIGNLSLPMQAKLLGALESMTVTRVGSDRPVKVDARVICATNLSPAELRAPGRFRQDLLYRINTIEIRVPSLRERVDYPGDRHALRASVRPQVQQAGAEVRCGRHRAAESL